MVLLYDRMLSAGATHAEAIGALADEEEMSFAVCHATLRPFVGSHKDTATQPAVL